MAEPTAARTGSTIEGPQVVPGPTPPGFEHPAVPTVAEGALTPAIGVSPPIAPSGSTLIVRHADESYAENKLLDAIDKFELYPITVRDLTSNVNVRDRITSTGANDGGIIFTATYKIFKDPATGSKTGETVDHTYSMKFTKDGVLEEVSGPDGTSRHQASPEVRAAIQQQHERNRDFDFGAARSYSKPSYPDGEHFGHTKQRR